MGGVRLQGGQEAAGPVLGIKLEVAVLSVHPAPDVPHRDPLGGDLQDDPRPIDPHPQPIRVALSSAPALEPDGACITLRDGERLLDTSPEGDAWLASEEAYRDENRERLKATLAEQGDATWKLARLETEWLEVAEALERTDERG